MRSSRFLLPLIGLLSIAATKPVQLTVSPAEAEAQKCEDKIASVRRDVFAKYDDQLGELLVAVQKAADLEGSLAVRAERQRLATEQDLSEANYVSEPKALRALQVQTSTRLQELTAQLVQETVPRLVEFKKQLTVAGKLDEAVTVRTAIEHLQNTHLSNAKPEAGAIVPVETLLLAYAGDRARADSIYKGQKITIHGILGGYRPDPSDAKTYQFYLSGSSGTGWVQCSFPGPEYHFREEKGSFGAVSLIVFNKQGDAIAHVQKGQTLDVRGRCEGFEDVVRFDRCDFPK